MNNKRPVVAARRAEFARYVARKLEEKSPEITRTDIIYQAAAIYQISFSTAFSWLRKADLSESLTPAQAEQVLRQQRNKRSRKNRRDATLANYGMTESQYNQKLADQLGGCAICGTKPKKRRLAIDHNHQTGQVRGLLCTHCNLSIAQESPELLRRAALYLEFYMQTNVSRDEMLGPVSRIFRI